MTGPDITRRSFIRRGMTLSSLLALGVAAPAALRPALALAQDADPCDAAPAALPLPDSARGPAVPQDTGYLVQEVKDGIFYVTEGIYQAMFLTTGQGVIAVDAPRSLGPNVLKAIADVTSEPVRWVIYSHTHSDHIGAASLYPPDATVIAHSEVAAKLARIGDSRRPMPTVTFDESYVVEAGSQRLELHYPGPNHEPGNSFVYAPAQKVLMAVDVIFPGWVPFKNLAVSHDIPGWIAAHDAILEYDFETLVAGHLTRLGTPDDVLVQREYVQDLQANAMMAMQTTDFMAIAQQTGFENLWLLFRTYQDTIAKTAAEATIAKWGGRLGGADVYTYDHAWTMQESLSIDF